MGKLAKAITEYVRGARIEPFETDGVQGKRVSINRFVSVYYAAFDGHLVVTTSEQGVADLKSDDDRLADDEAFKGATSAAGMPDETTGFLYIDLAKALPAVLGLAGADGMSLPETARANLEPLHSLVVYGTHDGDVAKFVGVLAIQ
ncbi:MAG TPA: hypothetical protein VH281_07575, partial [Gaiellaceae bacterium]